MLTYLKALLLVLLFIHWLFDWLQCAVIPNQYVEFCHDCVRRIRQIGSCVFSNTETNQLSVCVMSQVAMKRKCFTKF
jgi:hypothetical protein